MKYKRLGGTKTDVSAVGQGCMGIGGSFTPDARNDAQYVYSLQLGIELGMTFIDTAEVYGGGHSEELVGSAIKGARDKVFVATKVSPENLTYNGVLKAAESSLRRLKTERIDLYQIHWPNPTIPISETMRAMEKLVSEGKIGNIGVSNFSLRDLKQATESLSAERIVSVQVEYNLFDRFIERDILPYCEHESITTVAYSPLDQGRIAPGDSKMGELRSIADTYGKTSSQITLNWLISHPSVIVIPKSSAERHIRENALSADFELSAEDFKRVSQIFKNEYVYVPTDRIKVSLEGEGKRDVYQTIENALANKLGFIPSPMDLAQSFKNGDVPKPVRLISTKDASGKYDYDLIEGRVRYWAWVIAHGGRLPVPAYIRNA